MAASVVQDTKEKGVKYVSTYYNKNSTYYYFFKNCKMVAIKTFYGRATTPLSLLKKKYKRKKTSGTRKDSQQRC